MSARGAHAPNRYCSEAASSFWNLGSLQGTPLHPGDGPPFTSRHPASRPVRGPHAFPAPLIAAPSRVVGKRHILLHRLAALRLPGKFPRTPPSPFRAASRVVCALAPARRNTPRRADLRGRRRGTPPATPRSLRLPGKSPRAPLSPHAGCVSAQPAHSLPLVAACLDVPSSSDGEGEPPSPPCAAYAAPKCDPQAGRHMQGDTRLRPLCLPLCYVFDVT